MAAPATHEVATAGGEAGHAADTTWLFGLLSVLLALSLILHQLWWAGFEIASPHAVVVLAAGVAMLRPTSVGAFALMLAAEVVAVGLDMPLVGSHTLLVLIVAGGVLVQLGWTTLRARRPPGPAAAFAAIAPFLRLSLVVVYATAALAKMNTGFLDPATSCAASMSQQVAWFDPALLSGSWRVGPAIWGTVAIEVALPVLLAVRRTRLVGVVVGGGFHVVLALAGNVPFTALAFAFYVVFLPLDTAARVRALRLPRLPVGRGARLVAGLVIVALWLAGHALGAADPALTGTLIGNGTRGVVVLVALVCGGVLVATRLRAPDPPVYPPGSLRVRSPMLVAGVALLVLNGASPYLGLKTDASFEMFSNLRTEPGAWNHALVPESARVFPYQEQQVRVVASNDPALLARGGGAARMVAFELDRYLRTHPGASATVDVAGEDTPQRVGPLPPGPTPAERIAVFRDVPPPAVPRC